MIKTDNLQKLFTTDEVETTALNGVSMDIQPGEFVAMMGPSRLRQIHAAQHPGFTRQSYRRRLSFFGTEVAG